MTSGKPKRLKDKTFSLEYLTRCYWVLSSVARGAHYDPYITIDYALTKLNQMRDAPNASDNLKLSIIALKYYIVHGENHANDQDHKNKERNQISDNTLRC